MTILGIHQGGIKEGRVVGTTISNQYVVFSFHYITYIYMHMFSYKVSGPMQVPCGQCLLHSEHRQV